LKFLQNSFSNYSQVSGSTNTESKASLSEKEIENIFAFKTFLKVKNEEKKGALPTVLHKLMTSRCCTLVWISNDRLSLFQDNSESYKKRWHTMYRWYTIVICICISHDRETTRRNLSSMHEHPNWRKVLIKDRDT